MTAPTADCADGAVEPAASALSSASSGRDSPNINPSTGLSSDYLNHFAEAIMVLELASTMPKYLDDLCAWQPKTYLEHFATSRFGRSDAIICAYQTADPAVRKALDVTAETLNAVLTQARDVLVQNRETPLAEELAQRALRWLRPLIARMAAVISGTADAAVWQSPQAAIDDMFDR